MRVAYITGKRGEVALGKEASKQAGSILIKRGSGMRLESVGYLAVPDKNKNTLHTQQATHKPRASGVFFHL
jgi:hypothetical protein